MTLNENTIRELLERATPGPWNVATFNLYRATLIDYQDAVANKRLAARAPELAADWLRMRDELTEFRNLQHEVSINYAFFSRSRREAAESTRDRIDRILEGETND